MILANLTVRVGRELNEKGFMSVVYDQYDKTAENNRSSQWLSLWVPESLRNKASEYKKGTPLIVSGTLRISINEYEGNKKPEMVLFADSVQKTINSNGTNFFMVRNARLGKDLADTRNGGAFTNVASSSFRNGEEETTWVTIFFRPEDTERAYKMFKKGSAIDLVSDRLTVGMNNGYLSVTMNVAGFGYGATIPKTDQEPKQKEEETEVAQAASAVEDEAFNELDSLEDYNDFF